MNKFIQAKGVGIGYLRRSAVGCQSNLFLCMRLTCFFTIAFCIQVCAATVAQTVDIAVKEASLRSVMVLIQKQTDYSFVADAELLEKAKPVTVTIKGKALREALPLIFADQPFYYAIKGKGITLVEWKKADTHNRKTPEEQYMQQIIRGRVTDSLGNPLPGVTVAIKGTSTVTATDEQGYYQLTAATPDPVLVFSSLGFLLPMFFFFSFTYDLHKITLQR